MVDLAARLAVGNPRLSRAMVSTPNPESMIRAMEKTPALTTATAWRRAETGVGATMAEGSQLCSGMMAALARPKM